MTILYLYWLVEWTVTVSKILHLNVRLLRVAGKRLMKS